MRFQDVTNTRPVIQIGLFIGHHMPRWVGYGMARAVAGFIAWRRPQVYQAVLDNLRQVLGPDADAESLHSTAYNVFYHSAKTLYDFFRAIQRPGGSAVGSVRVPEPAVARVKADLDRGQGVLLLGSHTSNFNLAAFALVACGLPVQVLSLPDPSEGYRIFDRLRAMGGMEVTPISPGALRGAVRRLRKGGLVMTGADRPVPGEGEMIEFFGRPACLPTGPARLAMLAGATVYVAGCRYTPGGEYVLDLEGPIELVRSGDRRRDALDNARRVARVMEKHIRAHPEQWMMFQRVWPTLADS